MEYLQEDKVNRSHLTAIRRINPSLPLRWLVENNHITEGWLLDYGCGHGKDVEWLMESHDIDAVGYDPYHRQETWPLDDKWNVITCTYVLNVVPPRREDVVLDVIRMALAVGGTAYITVRRDIPEDKTGYKTSKGTYQRWVDLPAPYEKLRETSTYCIYKYTRRK